MKKNMKGITLVSLVITIIVMLILAGVSISMATNNNGVLTRGQQAASKTKLGTIMDELNMAATSVDTDYQSEWAMNPSVFVDKPIYATVDKFNKYLTTAKILAKTNGSEAATITKSGLGSVKGAKAGANFKTIAQVSSDDGTSGACTGGVYVSNCGKCLSVIYLSDGSSETELGNAVYAALFYMEKGVPIFVDVGVISETCSVANETTGCLKWADSADNTGRLGVTKGKITWLKNAEAGKYNVPKGQE